MCLGVFLLGFILSETLCFLDLVDYFLSRVRGVFSYYLFKYFFRSFSLSAPSRTPTMRMLVYFTLYQMPLMPSSFFFFLFYILCWGSDPTILSSMSLICSSASVFCYLFLQGIIHLCLAWSNPPLDSTGSQFSSVQFSCPVVSDSLRPHELQHARPPCPSPIPRVHPDSSPSSRWCHPAISSSVVPVSSCAQSLPASEFFPMGQLSHEVAKVLEFQL